jgi:type IV pilus assembly protein PilE
LLNVPRRSHDDSGRWSSLDCGCAPRTSSILITQQGVQMNAASRKPAKGFTLIEVMIVVGVVAILAAIALPSYRDYVLRGKITEAVSTLSDLRLRAEKFFGDNRTYVGFNTATPGTRYFTFACVIAATTFACTATGVATQGMNGFVYTVNEANVRNSTFTEPGWINSTTCWVSKKGETC